MRKRDIIQHAIKRHILGVILWFFKRVNYIQYKKQGQRFLSIAKKSNISFSLCGCSLTACSEGMAPICFQYSQFFLFHRYTIRINTGPYCIPHFDPLGSVIKTINFTHPGIPVLPCYFQKIHPGEEFLKIFTSRILKYIFFMQIFLIPAVLRQFHYMHRYYKPETNTFN